MSSPIWTAAALLSELRSHTGRCWRLVEAQHWVSTLKLVDTLAEQALLEELVEASKPTMPVECRPLDYLLATPFRYGAEYPHGSRFRRAGKTLGVYYAAEHVETAVAEMAFYRLLFFAESPQTAWPANAADYTAFAADIATHALLDLTREPLSRDRQAWIDPLDYTACQGLADQARAAGAQAIRTESARDPQGRANLALLTCHVFARPEPVERQSWRIRLSARGVQALCDFPRLQVEFGRDAFADDPRIDALIWERQAVS
jgi:hypothetical protein